MYERRQEEHHVLLTLYLTDMSAESVGGRTVDSDQVPVDRLAGTQHEGEGLGVGGLVLVLGLDDDRLWRLYADKGLRLHQRGDFVIDIQEPHGHHMVRRHVRVGFTAENQRE